MAEQRAVRIVPVAPEHAQAVQRLATSDPAIAAAFFYFVNPNR